MTVRMRLNGDPAEIEAMLQLIETGFELSGSGRVYPNRGTRGVRVYLTAWTPHNPGRPGRHGSGRGGQHRKGGESK